MPERQRQADRLGDTGRALLKVGGLFRGNGIDSIVLSVNGLASLISEGGMSVLGCVRSERGSVLRFSLPS